MEFLLFGLLALVVPFVLPIASWVSAQRTRSRVLHLESIVEEQRAEVERLSKRLAELRREVRPASVAGAPETAAPVPPQPVVPRPAVPPAAAPPRPAAPPPAAVPPRPAAVPPAVTPAPIVQNPWPDDPPRKPAEAVPPRPPVVERPRPEIDRADAGRPLPRPPVPPAAPPPAPPRASRPVVPPPPPPPPQPAFDWESLVGVKLFSAIAGIALVFAAVFFLRYTVQQGWLQPPVRVAIGILVGITLLVLCELKAARRYPATANALDAAAIAILFSTFFAAHSLWDLIPGGVAFGLLALVTAVAVLLSIRRESLFIAVLGLLGGFATPALLSTGENRPIPLFAYLLLLNVGLAWVAYRQTWPVLTVLTLVLTTIYQWGWVFKFLSVSEVPLAMGVFLIFPATGLAALLLARTPPDGRSSGGLGGRATFERTAVAAAVMPVLFAAYLAVVPAYGARPALLFGFLALVDAGLLAIALARGFHILHAIGAYATVLVAAMWLGISYRPEFSFTTLAFTSGFAVLYLAAPVVAGWLSRSLEGPGAAAVYAAPVLLFVFPALAYMDRAFATPQPLFAVLLGLLTLCAWRAIHTRDAYVFFIGSFFAVAAQAVWSVQYLTLDRLGTAVALYAIFGVVSAVVPALARGLGRALQPAEAAGVTLLANLALLLFIAAGDVAPAALWALALLLAILNAALFVESAGAGLPETARAGTVLSWGILGVWWMNTAGAVGVVPSLAVLTGLSLVTLAGYAWASRVQRPGGNSEGFASGQYLALGGHLFLFFMAGDPRWSVPPWPLFGALAVISLATSAASLATRAAAIHVAGVVGAATIVMVWTASARGAAGLPTIGVAAASAVSLFALAWMPVARRDISAAAAAVATLFASELTLMVAVATSDPPPFAVVVAVHAANAAALVALGWIQRWGAVGAGAAMVAAAAVFEWQVVRPAGEWRQLLTLAAAFYAVFTAYPLVVGPRAREDREPWFVALISAVTTFFAARHAFIAGGLEWMIGVVPVVQGLVTAVLLRALLRLEPAGRRDLGRLALVAGAALAFVTVAIPLQLEHQWITIGWTLEGAALAWLYRRVPHRGVLIAASLLLGAVFVRLVLNPEVFLYEPRSAMRILNWYLYTYLIAASAFFAAAWWLSRTEDSPAEGFPRMSRVLPAGGVILLFVLLNIEIADYYSTGPEIVFRFGVTVSQDLTYTIGWLAFGMILLAAGIYAGARAARIAAVALIAVTTFKCFLYDLGSLEGLYRVASFVGLALSLALVSIALQRFVLDRSKEPRESAT